MMPLAVGNNLEQDWFTEVDGDGVITYSADGHVATCSSTIGVSTNRAYLRQYIQIRGGEVLRLRVLCRVTSGEGLLAIDYPNRGEPAVTKRLNATDHGTWQEHEIVTRVGYTVVPSDDSISVIVGSTLSTSGTIEIANISVDIESGSNGALRTHACGSITISKDGAGVVTVAKDNDYFNSGVLNITNNNTNLLVELEPLNNTEGFTGARYGALCFASVNSTITGLSVYASPLDVNGDLTLTLSDSSGLFDTSTVSMPNSSSITLFFEVRTV